MKNEYESFEELKNSENIKNYHIATRENNSCFIIFAPHGGGIEPGTSEICDNIANNTYGSYLFEGKGKGCKRLHITSHKFDEPTLIDLLNKYKYGVSIHGMTSQAKKDVGADIYLGGKNKDLIVITTALLKKCKFGVTNNIINPGSTLSGDKSQNVTNKCISKLGMQIEISEDLRKRFFINDYSLSKNRKRNRTKAFCTFCNAIKKSIEEFNS